MKVKKAYQLFSAYISIKHFSETVFIACAIAYSTAPVLIIGLGLFAFAASVQWYRYGQKMIKWKENPNRKGDEDV